MGQSEIRNLEDCSKARAVEPGSERAQAGWCLPKKLKYTLAAGAIPDLLPVEGCLQDPPNPYENAPNEKTLWVTDKQSAHPGRMKEYSDIDLDVATGGVITKY